MEIAPSFDHCDYLYKISSPTLFTWLFEPALVVLLNKTRTNG